jgi:hypothetical protein
LDEQRQTLLTELSDVRKAFGNILQRRPHLPAVARVILKKEALAKSHRPTNLFEKDSCPIIGGEDFGHLLVSVTNTGLIALEKNLARGTTNNLKADVSTLRRIEPYTADDAAGDGGVSALQRLVAERRPDQIRLRLFKHGRSRADEAIFEELISLARELNLEVPESLPYLSELRMFRIRGITPEVIPVLASFVGTQSIGLVPEFEVTAQYVPVGQLSEADFPAPSPNVDYPVVGVIDTGTDPANELLQAWVVDRDEEDVPRADQDNSHGSFVAGLIANGFHLNHKDPQFPRTQCRIVDVVAVPKAATPLTEDDLLTTIRRVVRKYPDVRVWNLSLSRKDRVCRDDAFSEFAMELDKIQQEFDVSFVSCAGNYEELPLRGWPPEDLGERDRIHPPADSALGIAVGAVAHVDRTSSRVRPREPSPFSRRGPGAAFLPKPEVGHIGGNCDGHLNYRQVGVLSLSTNGQVCEAIGTSFSTPIVSSILANIRSVPRSSYFTYDASWRVLEELQVDMVASDPVTTSVTLFSNIWGIRYIDDAVARVRTDLPDNTPQNNVGTTILSPVATTSYHLLTDVQFSVVATIGPGLSTPVDRIEYSPYGVAGSTPAGDVDRSGEVDINDLTIVNALWSKAIGEAEYTPDFDFNRDGVIDDADADFIYSAQLGAGSGVMPGQLGDSRALSGGPRLNIGYCGYIFNDDSYLYTVRCRMVHEGTTVHA